jgi:energy-coupling factor transporter ATP-binding protein EcfA2
MPAKVSNITINGFRGATSRVEIPFDTSKSMTLIFGENGTGKSTIIDAFDFVCNRAYGSLDSYSLGTPSQKRKHIASLKGKQSDLKISLSCGTATWTATLGTDGPIISPESGYPDVRILRRKSILGLIEEQASKRYDSLKAFIAVPGIEKSEKALREAIITLESNYNEAIRALGQANEALERLWGDEGKPGANAIDWASVEAGKDITQLQKIVSEMCDLETAFQGINEDLLSLDKALSELKTAQESHTKAEDKQKEAEGKQSQKNSQLLKLLEDAKTYIALKGSLVECPVCEQGIDAGKLVKRIGERINEMQEIVPLVNATRKAIRDTETKKTVADEKQKVFCERAKTLCTLAKQSTLSEVKAIQIDWADFDVLLSYQEPTDTVEQQGRQLASFMVPLQKPLRLLKDSDQKSIIQHNAIKGHIESLKQKALDATVFETLVKKLKAALDIVSQQRKSYVEEILSGIAAEVETLYTKMHPGEGIGKIRFFLKPNAIGSLEFDGQFHDMSELPPQAYYSESHLDTLGICVFLALSNRFKTEKTVVILDDVLTSIDGPHLDRFISLIHEQAASFNQLIVATHYRPWRDRYRWAKGPTANTQVIELGPWTLQKGLQTRQFLTAVVELQENLKVSHIDRQAIASKAGIVLESLLDFITLKYHCSIPRNVRNEFTLWELASGIDSMLGKELRISKHSTSCGTKTDTVLKPLIDACISEQWIRNVVGCHFSALGSEITDGDVRKFCENVLAMAAELICDSCGMLPTRRPSGSYWQCNCGKLELYPLIYPGSDPKMVDDES